LVRKPSGPQLAGTVVAAEAVDLGAREKRAFHLPVLPLQIAAQKKPALAGADKDLNLAYLGLLHESSNRRFEIRPGGEGKR